MSVYLYLYRGRQTPFNSAGHLQTCSSNKSPATQSPQHTCMKTWWWGGKVHTSTLHSPLGAGSAPAVRGVRALTERPVWKPGPWTESPELHSTTGHIRTPGSRTSICWRGPTGAVRRGLQAHHWLWDGTWQLSPPPPSPMPVAQIRGKAQEEQESPSRVSMSKPVHRLWAEAPSSHLLDFIFSPFKAPPFVPLQRLPHYAQCWPLAATEPRAAAAQWKESPVHLAGCWSSPHLVPAVGTSALPGLLSPPLGHPQAHTAWQLRLRLWPPPLTAVPDMGKAVAGGRSSPSQVPMGLRPSPTGSENTPKCGRSLPWLK